MKVVIPMAGLGSRFGNLYSEPKPLIPVNGKPMIQRVVEHIGLQHLHHVFICQKTHVEKFKLHELFATIVTNFSIIEIDGLTEGAAISVLQANSVMKDNDDFIIVNSDQFTHWDKDLSFTKDEDLAGLIFCFSGTGNNWSYAKLDDRGQVIKVVEKQQISEYATSGVYYWKRWSDFRKAVSDMKLANDRVNNEFYVAPTYNYLPGKILIKMVKQSDQVGTPEELNRYLAVMTNNV